MQIPLDWDHVQMQFQKDAACQAANNDSDVLKS